MTQNMFQEGLYHVFFKDRPPGRSSSQVTAQGELVNVRIHRWFSTVVNTRLLVTGVVQMLSALGCILTTVTHVCASYSCSVSMTTPVWSSLCYVAAGCQAVLVQRKASKVKILILLGLNIFCLLFGFTALVVNSAWAAELVPLNTFQQRVGSYLAKGSSMVFSVMCFLASTYVLFLCWKGLRRYSPQNSQAYSRLAQEPDETNGPLDEQEIFSL